MARNFIDKAIELVAPVHGAKRAAARVALDFKNSGYGNYGANLTKKSMRGWEYFGGSSKEDIEDNISILRQRSRDAYMGVPVATAALKTMRTNVIAGGLMPAPQIDADYLKLSDEQAEALRQQIVREFSLWADTPDCDAERIDNFYKLQQLAFLSKIMNGDAFVLLPFCKRAGQPYDLRIKVIEADRVCSPDNADKLYPCYVGGRRVERIVQGVETDSAGTVVAYWFSNRHPLADNGYDNTWARVEAFGKNSGRRNVLHLMSRERCEQVRGVPLLAPVLEALKQLGRYTDAEIMAAVISAMFTVFIQSETANDGRPLGEMLPPGQQIDSADPSSIELGPAAIMSLNPGETVAFADPKHPNAGYDAFTNAMILQIGASLEIPQEVMMKQFTTSYSAARGALNEFWRTAQMYRDWFIDDFCQPIYEMWFAEAVAKGRISAPGFFDDPAIRKAYTGCVWNGPARTNLNPVQEVDAAIKRVDAGFSTGEEETAQMTGGSYSANINRRKIEVAKMREAGLSNDNGGNDNGE